MNHNSGLNSSSEYAVQVFVRYSAYYGDGNESRPKDGLGCLGQSTKHETL